VRLQDMTVGHLRQALAVYARVAWDGAGMQPPEVPGADADPLEPALREMVSRHKAEDETLRTGEQATRRFALRLGHTGYPFMKLMLQEHLVEGEFFFDVDTHDQMLPEEGEEAGQIRAMKAANLRVKESVEHALDVAGLPTARHIKGLVESWPARRASPNGRRILLVDNEADIAATLAMLLEGAGYAVDVCHDGREAIQRADPARHDLVLMDNEMPDLNGFEACRVLKHQPATARLPVLIATAGSLTLSQLDAADGFMVKPFRMELLFSILEQMLGRRERL
jgi:CheY-like chemotaxis protein